MGQQTTLMEWQQTMDRLNKASVQEQAAIWEEVKELEEYMVNKGYEFHHNRVLNPQGEIVWTRN